MMRRTAATPLLLAALACASGCSTPPTRYYTLSAARGVTAPEPASARVLAVGPISIPDYLDRPGIVVRENENQVHVAVYDQWAGSLQDMLARVLLENLAAHLPDDRVISFPRSDDLAFDSRLAVEIVRFDVSTAGEAVAEAHWQLYAKAGAKPLSSGECEGRAQAAGTTYEQRVAALSQALAKLAEEMARALPARAG